MLNGPHCVAAENGDEVLATVAARSAQRIKRKNEWAGLFFFRQPSVTPRPGLSFSHCFRIFVIASQWLESGARSTRVVNINPFSLAVISKVPAVCVASCS